MSVEDLGSTNGVIVNGQRVTNDQDGVPYVTQKPVASGAAHHYSFVHEDAGTFLGEGNPARGARQQAYAQPGLETAQRL